MYTGTYLNFVCNWWFDLMCPTEWNKWIHISTFIKEKMWDLVFAIFLALCHKVRTRIGIAWKMIQIQLVRYAVRAFLVENHHWFHRFTYMVMYMVALKLDTLVRFMHMNYVCTYTHTCICKYLYNPPYIHSYRVSSVTIGNYPLLHKYVPGYHMN